MDCPHITPFLKPHYAQHLAANIPIAEVGMHVIDLAVACMAGLALVMGLFAYGIRRHWINEPLLALLVGVLRPCRSRMARPRHLWRRARDPRGNGAVYTGYRARKRRP